MYYTKCANCADAATCPVCKSKVTKKQSSPVDEREITNAVMRRAIVRNPAMLDEMSFEEIENMRED